MEKGFVHRLYICAFALIVALVALVAPLAPGQATKTATARDATATPHPLDESPAVVVSLEGTIDNYVRDNLFKRFAKAKELGAKTVILKINTYGGLVTSALDITQFLRAQDDLRVVALVERRAYSAGAMIALACDEMVMEPGAFVGDCAPIMISPTGELATLGETERAKQESPILADFEASARRNGYDPLLVTSMVTLKRGVHYVQDADGSARKFVTPDQYKDLTAKGWKPVEGVRDPVNDADKLLTVDSVQAERIGLSKGTYASADALASARGWQILQRFEPTFGETFVGWLNSAAVRAILIFILIQSLYISLTHPGHGMPEAIAMTALGVVLVVPMMTGYASWVEIACVIIGLSLLALEIFVIPGFGVTGVSGIVLIVIGLILTFVGPEPSSPGFLPALPATWSALQRGTIYVTGALVACLICSIALARYMPALPLFNRLILTATSPTPTPQAATLDAPLPQKWPAVGAVGVTVVDLRPGGSAAFADPSTGGDRIADVVSESGFVARGTKVVVRDLRAGYAVVRAAPADVVVPSGAGGGTA